MGFLVEMLGGEGGGGHSRGVWGLGQVLCVVGRGEHLDVYSTQFRDGDERGERKGRTPCRRGGAVYRFSHDADQNRVVSVAMTMWPRVSVVRPLKN